MTCTSQMDKRLHKAGLKRGDKAIYKFSYFKNEWNKVANKFKSVEVKLNNQIPTQYKELDDVRKELRTMRTSLFRLLQERSKFEANGGEHKKGIKTKVSTTVKGISKAITEDYDLAATYGMYMEVCLRAKIDAYFKDNVGGNIFS